MNTAIVFLFGDFNSRIGTPPGHVNISDKCVELRGSTLGDHRKKNNLDSEINESARQVIQFCKSFSRRILNGRKTGDLLGDFTHYNMNDGQSVVNLAFVYEAFFDNVKKFMVFPLSELTDHCKIVLEIPNVISESRPYKWTNLKPSYKRDKNSASKFLRKSKIRNRGILFKCRIR